MPWVTNHELIDLDPTAPEGQRYWAERRAIEERRERTWPHPFPCDARLIADICAEADRCAKPTGAPTMDIDDVLELIRERVEFFNDCGDINANEGGDNEAQVMYAGARQWQDAHDAVKALRDRHEICLDNCGTCDSRLRDALERLALQ